MDAALGPGMTGAVGSLGATMKRQAAVSLCALMGALSLFTSGCGLARLNSRASLSAQVDADAMCNAELPKPTLWSVSEQRRFRTKAARGPVVVSQQGCRVVVLPACEVLGVSSYATNDTVPTRHEKLTRLSAQAAMEMPWLNAAGDTSGEVSYRDVIVAHHNSALTARTVLTGACGGASHVVMGYSTGAYQLQASTVHSGRMDNSVVSGQANTSSGVLSSMGDVASCASLPAGSGASSPACGAVVELELASLAALCAGHNCAPVPAAATPPAPVPAPLPSVAPVVTANTCTNNLPACQQRCEAGDSAACSALSSACTLGFNLQACQLYWSPIIAMK